MTTRNATASAPARPFVGREAEFEELVAALGQARDGNGHVFFLTGEPGIGKTRLMQELTRLARERGWQVAAGGCWEEGGAPAYWPWIQAVRELGGDFERCLPARRAGSTRRPLASGSSTQPRASSSSAPRRSRS